MRIMGKTECNDCVYYDRLSGFCGFCMQRILKEVEEIQRKDSEENGSRQDGTKGTE